MLVQHLGRGFEPDDLRLGVHVLHIVEEAGSAAATADDDILKLGHLVQHVALNATEALLALLGKDLAHLLAHAALDVPVKVVERHVQLFGQGAADGGLAGAHVTD